MAKKKQKKKLSPGAGDGVKPVRLSQCMIVKNEEKNIERALSWAKGLAFEQIVVDTGSTDRTVEIAESLGAKVFHFEWINDFSAAKNYAIEQASGRWIAFLDADEYFPEENAKKLMKLLERITNEQSIIKKYVSVFCPLYNVDDAGVPVSTYQHCRIFRNLPEIRYSGKIHETLSLGNTLNLTVSDIGIIHTGYTDSAYMDTNKAQRNIELLEKELAENPNNPELKCYLADSLHKEGSPESFKRAEMLYTEALESGNKLRKEFRHSAYFHLVAYHDHRGETERAAQLCQRAIDDCPEVPDFYAHLGIVLYNRQEYAPAWEALKKCEELLDKNSAETTTNSVISKPIVLFSKLAQTAQALGDSRGVVHYSVLTLREDKYQKMVLAPLIRVLTEDVNTSDSDIFGLLGKLYDFGNNKDRALILVSAKMAGNRAVFDMTRSTFTDEEIGRLKIPAFEAEI